MSEKLALSAAPATEPITLTEAKLWLKVDDSTDDDLITALIIAARQACEDYTHRSLITQTWQMTLDRFPNGCDPILLPPWRRL